MVFEFKSDNRYFCCFRRNDTETPSLGISVVEGGWRFGLQQLEPMIKKIFAQTEQLKKTKKIYRSIKKKMSKQGFGWVSLREKVLSRLLDHKRCICRTGFNKLKQIANYK